MGDAFRGFEDLVAAGLVGVVLRPAGEALRGLILDSRGAEVAVWDLWPAADLLGDFPADFLSGFPLKVDAAERAGGVGGALFQGMSGPE